LVGRAIEAKLKPLNSRVKTLKVDNGKEFADQTLGIQTYFADPYCVVPAKFTSSQRPALT
jgi:IS30 family transposase